MYEKILEYLSKSLTDSVITISGFLILLVLACSFIKKFFNFLKNIIFHKRSKVPKDSRPMNTTTNIEIITNCAIANGLSLTLPSYYRKKN